MIHHLSSVSRRRFLTSITGSVAGAGVLGSGTATDTRQAQSSSTGDDWSQFRADAGNTAHLPNGVGPGSSVHQTWKVENGSVRDSVAIVDGTVYIGGTSLVAFNAVDGSKRWELTPEWQTQYSEHITGRDVGPPAVMNGTVYATVALETEQGFVRDITDTALVAVAADTGKQRWQVTSRGSTPVTLVDDTLITVGSPPDDQEGERLYGFGLDGSVRWQYRIDRVFPGAIPASEGRVYVLGAKGMGVRALDMATGRVVWTALPKVSFDSTEFAVMSNGTLFVVESNHPGVTLIALDAQSGAEHWRTAYSTDVLSMNITADAETIYVQVYGMNADVIALNRATGDERWRTHIEQPTDNREIPTRRLALVGGRLYVGASCLNPDDGSLIWTKPFPIPDDPYSAYRELQAVAGGRMYFLEQRAKSDTPLPDRLLVLTDTNKQSLKQTQTSTATPTQTSESIPTRTPSPTQSAQTRTEQTVKTGMPTGTHTSDSTQSEPTQTVTATPTMTTQATGKSPTTTADGPGFGLVAALGGIGLGAWRYLSWK